MVLRRLRRNRSNTRTPMKVEVFTICDYAQADPTGKLHIIGVFDRIFGNIAPATHLTCCIVARLRFDSIEVGLKAITIRFINADGASVMPELRQQFQVQVPPPEQSSTTNLILLIQQLVLPSFGDYSIDLAVDGRLEASYQLSYRQAVLPPTPPSPPPLSELPPPPGLLPED